MRLNICSRICLSKYKTKKSHRAALFPDCHLFIHFLPFYPCLYKGFACEYPNSYGIIFELPPERLLKIIFPLCLHLHIPPFSAYHFHLFPLCSCFSPGSELTYTGHEKRKRSFLSSTSDASDIYLDGRSPPARTGLHSQMPFGYKK